MFPAGLTRRQGDGHGFTRRPQWHAEWPAWPQQPQPAKRWRNVADDHGDPGVACHKAVKHIGGSQPGAASTPAPAPGNAGLPGGGMLGGGLGGLLQGSLGGLLAGGAAGSVISGGLGDLLKQLQQNGHADTANSWVKPGPNKPISPGDLASALGADQIDNLAAQSGMSRDELLAGLSQHLPEVVNHLTPDGRLPTEEEVSDKL